ncbi:MAG: protein kinase [Gammaproteobacteria bacterium]|nr:protein kinase [Gammaproteobacteria bacterium]
MVDERRKWIERLSGDKLTELTIHVVLGTDRQSYTLKEYKGRGRTGVTWRAEDQFHNTFAIKFVAKNDYRTHSLDAEVQHVARVESSHLAKIHFFGEPTSNSELELDDYYAIVMEWVDGQSLRCFLTDHQDSINLRTCMIIIRGLCEVVEELRQHGLCHNDLHGENVMITMPRSIVTDAAQIVVKVIDTGALKREERRLQLLDQWQQQLQELTNLGTTTAEMHNRIANLRDWIDWFARKDEQWIIHHLCSLLNCLYLRIPDLEAPERRFLRRVASLINLLLDENSSRALDEPRAMYRELAQIEEECRRIDTPPMSTPFDLMSAELIQDDRHLMALFSDKFPALDICRSSDPVYVYGPRGCGKSTVFRSLSMRTILQSDDPHASFQVVPFVGVYVSCTTELRSRFWLFSTEDFEATEPLIVRFFNLVLVEELVRTITAMVEYESSHPSPLNFGLTSNGARIAAVIRRRTGVNAGIEGYDAASLLDGLRWDVRTARDDTWAKVLTREKQDVRTNAQMIFDLCEELAELCPIFRDRRITFLLDDYSNQRIPPELQRRLNQSITFAKQGNPIFKVSSEYHGVDLTGIQQGREVREVNVGQRHTALNRQGRHRFLQSILQMRFQHFDVRTPIDEILPPSGIGPSIPLAEAI